MSLRTALVAGATGFIGGAVARHLIAKGVDTYSLVFADRTRHRTTPGTELISASSRVEDIRAVLAGHDFDAVMLLAASGVAPQDRDPERLLDGNVRLAGRLWHGIVETRPKMVLFAGSCAEYSPISPPALLREEHPTQPANLYGAAKAGAVLWAQATAARLGLPLAVLRLFHTFGPGEAPTRLVPHLTHHLIHQSPADLTGGEQVRDLLYVDDVANAFAIAAEAQLEPQSVFNVCSGVPVSIRTVAETLVRLTDRSPELLRFGALPYRTDEEMWIVGDNRRFKAATGWQPSTPLERGLALCLSGQTAPAL